MKGIREIALNKKPEPEKSSFDSEKYEYEKYDYDDFNGYKDYNHKNYSVEKDYNFNEMLPLQRSINDDPIIITEQITLSTTISWKEIGEIADSTSEKYNWSKADIKATDIAFKRFEKILMKNYNLFYELSEMKINSPYDDFEATMILTPIKT